MKNIYKFLVIIVLFLSLASPALAVVGNGSFGAWQFTDLNTLNPKIGNTNPAFWTANCTNILLMCGCCGHIYTSCKTYTTCTGVIPISAQSVGMNPEYGETISVGLYISNTATGETVYTGSTQATLGADPAPYKIPAVSSQLLVNGTGSIRAALFAIVAIVWPYVLGTMLFFLVLRFGMRRFRRR